MCGAVTEQDAMTRALELAWRGWGRVQPNPLVGAVILAGGDVVGEGWHAEFGERHAEPVALAAAGERARGATMVCTLEPCDHQGKQRSAGSFKSEAEARRNLRVTRDGVTPVTETKTYSSRALGSYAPVWLAGHQLEPRTRQSYRQVTGKWIIPYLGDRPISKITKADIRAWVSQMTRDGAGADRTHPH